MGLELPSGLFIERGEIEFIFLLGFELATNNSVSHREEEKTMKK